MQRHSYRVLLALLSGMRTRGRPLTPQQLQRATDERSLQPIAHAYNPVVDTAALISWSRRRRRAMQTHPSKRRRP